ncbi:hypothetical protein ABIA32_005347 [Streptacidiphilus sp. MAP12-20]|uniref:hypothetical protein n=1 Tax=Streptacidiphilus sp. MAP12-20 TaxID=3156299 RepID=UPI003517134C
MGARRQGLAEGGQGCGDANQTFRGNRPGEGEEFAFDSGAPAWTTTLTPTASQLPGVTGAGTIDGATLQVSYDDGSRWIPVALKRQYAGGKSGSGGSKAGDSWTVQISAPRWAHYVSLCAPPPGTTRTTPCRRRFCGPSE